jgi:hypothetical protein
MTAVCLWMVLGEELEEQGTKRRCCRQEEGRGGGVIRRKWGSVNGEEDKDSGLRVQL